MSLLRPAVVVLCGVLGGTALAQQAPPAPHSGEAGAPDAAVRRLELAYLRRRHDEARRWYEAGRYQAVIDRCTALLDLEPDLPWRDEVRVLRLRAKEKAQAEDVLAAELLPESRQVTLGTPIRLRVRLTARADDPVEWQLAGPGDDPGAHAVCDIQIREYGIGRIQAFESFRVAVVGLPLEAVLPKGDAIEGTVVIPTHDYAPLRPTPRAYRCIATIRPLRMVAGARAVHRQVLVPVADVLVVPPGAERLAGDPEGSMHTALREEWPFRVAVTALVTPADHRAAVAEILLDQLGGGFERSTMWPAVFGALRELTGEDLPDQRAAWLGYWSRIRRASAPAAGGDPTGGGKD